MAYRVITEELRQIARERSRAWREANRERHRLYSREHQKMNPVLMRLRGAKKRAKAIGKLHPNADYAIIKTIATLAYRLEKCVGTRMALDHIVPHKRGGYHHHANLQAIPFLLNAKKQDRTESIWAKPWGQWEDGQWLS